MFLYDFGANPIPVDPVTKGALIKWERWQNERMPREYFDYLCRNFFNEGNGVAAITGRLYEKNEGLNFIGIDVDNEPGVTTLHRRATGKNISREDFTKSGVPVDGYSEDKEHIYFTSKRQIKPLGPTSSNDPNCPKIEVRSIEKTYIIFAPSLSKDNKTKRQIYAYPDQELEFKECDWLEGRVDQILNEYGVSYLSDNGDSNDIPIADLFKKDFVIYEGHNRHKALLRVMDSLLRRNYGILDLETIKGDAQMHKNGIKNIVKDH